MDGGGFGIQGFIVGKDSSNYCYATISRNKIDVYLIINSISTLLASQSLNVLSDSRTSELTQVYLSVYRGGNDRFRVTFQVPLRSFYYSSGNLLNSNASIFSTIDKFGLVSTGGSEGAIFSFKVLSN